MAANIRRSKAEWRERARTNRAGLTIDHARVAYGIRLFLAKAPPGFVVLYAALPGEPEVSSLAAASLASDSTAPGADSGHRFALTRTPEDGTDLTVHPFDSVLERHRYGFEQPVSDSSTIDDDEIAVVLVPGLAFDMAGTRLGHGAGFYDRFLSRLGPDVLRVGVSDGFIVSELPVEDHDVPMTHLAGDMGVVELAGTQRR